MLDTNIFISMIFFPSVQTRELARKLTDCHQIVVCDYVIEELRLVVNRKFLYNKTLREDRTAAEENCVAEATRRRRRIPRSRILFYFTAGKDGWKR